jgi:hypothetical protein
MKKTNKKLIDVCENCATAYGYIWDNVIVKAKNYLRKLFEITL